MNDENEMLDKLVQVFCEAREERSNTPKSKEIQAECLRDIFVEATRPNPFKPGDLVEQKDHLHVYSVPGWGEIAIVVEQIEPVHEIADGVDTKNDLRVLALLKGKYWAIVAVESWRFQIAQVSTKGVN